VRKVPMTQGRIVIPASMRKKFGLTDGDVLLDDEGPTLRVLSVREAVRKAQAMVAPFLENAGSLSEGLIQDRRSEAAREHGEG